MQDVTIAAGSLSGAVGGISAGGVSLVLIIVMVYGVIGKGKKKLASGPAQIVGIFGELAFLRSTGFTRNIGDAFHSVVAGLAENPALGNIGMTGVALVLIALSLFARIVPASGVFLGMLMGAAFQAADGSIWQAIVQIFSIPFQMMGV
ncbi:hypothetical protein ACFV4X_12760 [Streptomyces ardesiacus]|uniref:hypothetical protein n=1 Tax=Streptomyces ardesiacus TaxID=285564 RepID=UPI003662935C